MKKTVKKNIHEIKNIVANMPKTLNEAVYEDFSGCGSWMNEDELMDPNKKAPIAMDGQDAPQASEVPANADVQAQQAPVEEPVDGGVESGAPGEMPAGPEEAPTGADIPEESEDGDALNVEQFVDDIRKKSLRGMAQLAENPDDERYQLLKKIWQICDKKPEQQTAFSNPNNAMPQKKI